MEKEKIQTASLVDLKAELYRKQEEFKQQKLNDNGLSYIRPKTSEKKNDIWSKKNKGVLERAQKDFERKVEEENAFENSRRKLQEKAKMYDKITQGSEIPEEDGSKLYLVDFEKKVIDQMMDVREKDRERKKKEELEELRKQEEEILSKADIPPPASKDEEWVDYVDAFGRTRTCLRKDLKDLTERDKKSSGVRFTGPSKQNMPFLSSDKPTLLSEDMRREIQRQKWEEEAQANLDGPVHYSNVQFDEIRDHGTGFFQFSKTEETRQKEMETLGDLRQQTLDERSRRERLKEKRKAMLDARLAKVKKRKQGAGVVSTEDKEDVQLKVTGSDQEVLKKPAKEEPQLLTRDVNINKDKPEREWDKGKDRLFPYQNATTEEKYFQEKREERQLEFAPPSFYYCDTNKGTNSSANRNQQGGNRKSEFESPFAFSDNKQAHTRNKWNIPSSEDKSFECMPPTSYPGDNVIEKSNILSQTHRKLNSTATTPSNHNEKVESSTKDIEDFLKRERTEVLKTQQSHHTQLNIGSDTGSIQVGDIPLPKQTNKIDSIETNNTPSSTEVQFCNSDSSSKQNNASSGVAGYGLSPENQNITGGFQHNPMAQFDIYGQPNLNVPPPTAFSVVNPFLGTYSQTAGKDMESHLTSNDSYTTEPTVVPYTGYINNYTQQSADTASKSLTQITEETTRVLIPKSSIVDTRLIRNKNAIQSFDDCSFNETKGEETVSVDTSQQSDSDILVSRKTSNQSVFSSAPVKYPQSRTYETTENC